jgi:DNA-binding IclR family transcriptional regulator
VERAIELLLRVAATPESASLQELTEQVGYSKSTVHRLLGRLERLEVIERDPLTRRYRVGRRLREIRRSQWTELDPRAIALPYMEELRDARGETVSFHLFDGTEHVVIEKCEAPQDVRRVLAIGRRTNLSIGATAKAILAFLPANQAAAILAQTYTPEQPGASAADLQQVRAAGYALSVSERTPGIVSVSAPVFGRNGRVWGALSLSGPAFRFTAELARQSAPTLLTAAHAISRKLGQPTPPA